MEGQVVTFDSPCDHDSTQTKVIIMLHGGTRGLGQPGNHGAGQYLLHYDCEDRSILSV